MRFDNEAALWDEKPRRVELGLAVAKYAQKDCYEKKVLDFGCGTGLVSLNLDAKEILGVDLSCEMVDVFNKKAQKLGKNAKAICEDVNNVNIKFDVIVASMVFHHIENIQDMLRVLSEKLNNNGKLFIADLYLEDGTFHDKGNDDVYHFGFDKNSFDGKYFNRLNCEVIYKVKKHKEFDVCIWELIKKG
jgi:cyclopropane fatty-acyl-phospholipid synthase-like methyltransferase